MHIFSKSWQLRTRNAPCLASFRAFSINLMALLTRRRKRAGVSGFSLTSKWGPLGIACTYYPEFGINLGIPRPPLSRNKRPHAEKCRHQAHFSVGISVNYRNKNPSNILKSESQKNRNSGKHGITITAISVHKISSVYPHRSQYRP